VANDPARGPVASQRRREILEIDCERSGPQVIPARHVTIIRKPHQGLVLHHRDAGRVRNHRRHVTALGFPGKGQHTFENQVVGKRLAGGQVGHASFQVDLVGALSHALEGAGDTVGVTKQERGEIDTQPAGFGAALHGAGPQNRGGKRFGHGPAFQQIVGGRPVAQVDLLDKHPAAGVPEPHQLPGSKQATVHTDGVGSDSRPQSDRQDVLAQHIAAVRWRRKLEPDLAGILVRGERYQRPGRSFHSFHNKARKNCDHCEKAKGRTACTGSAHGTILPFSSGGYFTPAQRNRSAYAFFFPILCR